MTYDCEEPVVPPYIMYTEEHMPDTQELVIGINTLTERIQALEKRIRTLESGDSDITSHAAKLARMGVISWGEARETIGIKP